MADEFAIRERLQMAVAGNEPLDEFRSWLTAETWDLEPGDSGAVLSAKIKLKLAEYDRGDLDDEELMLELKRLATHVWTDDVEPVQVRTASNSTHNLGGLRYQVSSTPSVSA